MSRGVAMIPAPAEQSGSEDSFIGGRPKLPGPDIPACVLCGQPETFYLQVAFPADHPWADFSLAVFACTSCVNGEFLIPEMLKGSLPGAKVSTTFLEQYQRNFAFLVFPTRSAALITEYVPRVRFQLIRMDPQGERSFGWVGGDPEWILEDEGPALIGAHRAVFLLQLNEGYRYETERGAPRQVKLGLDGKPGPARTNDYRLFIGNAVYLFGPELPQAHVYALTQVD